MFRGEALTWWNLTRSTLTPDVLAKLLWPTFKKKVLDKYCSERARDKIEEEFRNLKKGNLSISDYSKQFVEKLSLVEHLATDEKMKIKAYHRGLPAEMKTAVRNAKVTTLQEVIEESFLVEDDLAQGRDERGQVGEKRKWEGPSGSVRQSKPYSGGRYVDSRHESRWCHKCKSKHYGPCNPRPYSGLTECAKCRKKDHAVRDCPIRGPVCFECREPGHVKRECPKLVGGSRGTSIGTTTRK